MKISSSYGTWKQELPRGQEACLAAFSVISSDEVATGIVDIWNAWVSVDNVLSNMGKYADNGTQKVREVLEQIGPDFDDAILKTQTKLNVFRKPDGSFVYNSSGVSSGKSMGASVAIAGTDEGDLNATVIGTTYMINTIFSCLNAGRDSDDKADAVPIALTKERAVFYNIVNDLDAVDKTGSSGEIGDPIDFEYSEIGDKPGDFGTGGDGNYIIVQDPEDENNKVFCFEGIAKADGNRYGDFFQLSNTGPVKNTTGMVFEGRMCFVSSDYVDGAIRLELGSDGDENNAYRINFKPTADGVEIWEYSSNIKANIVSNYLEGVEYGEWFKLRVEYYSGDHDSVRIKVYFNDKLIAVSDNYYDRYGNKLSGNGVPNTRLDLSRFYVLKDRNVKVLFDDLLSYRIQDKYEYEDLHEDYRYDPSAINVDNISEEDVIYGFEEFEAGENYPPAFKVDKADGEADVTVGQDNKTLLLTNGASVIVPAVKRCKTVNVSSVSFDVFANGAEDICTVDFLDLGRSNDKIFTVKLEVVDTGISKNLIIKDKTGAEAASFTLDDTGKARVTVSYYKSEDVALIYIEGKLRGMCSVDSTVLNFGKARISSYESGSLCIDNISVENNYADFAKETKPELDSFTHDFSDGTLGEVTSSGSGVSVSDSSLLVENPTSSTVVKVPLNKRDDIVNVTVAKFDIKYTAGGKNGLTQYISLTDKDGKKIISFAVYMNNGTAEIREAASSGIFSASVVKFSAENMSTLRFEYYETKGICEIYLGESLAFVSSLAYDVSSGSPEYLTFGEARSDCSFTLDNILCERLIKLYKESVLSENGEDEAEKITFDYSGATSYPKHLTASLYGPTSSIGVSSVIRNGIVDKVLVFNTVNSRGYGNDRLNIDPTVKVSGAKSYVFETDFMLKESDKGTAYQITFATADSKKAAEINVNSKDGKVYFTHRDHASGTITSNLLVGDMGEWIKLRAEYYTVTVQGQKETRLKVYADDKLLYITDLHFEAEVYETIDHISVMALYDPVATLCLDNISFAQSAKTYDGAEVTLTVPDNN